VAHVPGHPDRIVAHVPGHPEKTVTVGDIRLDLTAAQGVDEILII